MLVVGMAREKSTRCPNKMARSFADTTLFDIYLKKLETLSRLFPDIIIAVNKNDKILWEKANNSMLTVKERPDSSIAPASVLSSNFSFLKDYDQEFVLWVNGCFPFLKPLTVIEAVVCFVGIDNIKSLHCVREVKNWFWNEEEQPITIRSKNLSRTQDAIPLYESVHCFHIFRRKYLLDHCAYWDFTKNNPYLFKVENSQEFLDIDTELDFDICENLYKKEK